LNIRALDCTYKEILGYTDTDERSLLFDYNCIDKDYYAAKKPRIYVNSNEFYFNITKFAFFEYLIFDAINTMAYSDTIQEILKYSPILYCSASETGVSFY